MRVATQGTNNNRSWVVFWIAILHNRLLIAWKRALPPPLAPHCNATYNMSPTTPTSRKHLLLHKPTVRPHTPHLPMTTAS
jgi:hypothetical protein